VVFENGRKGKGIAALLLAAMPSGVAWLKTL
jgi:hypothetical protein